MRTIARKARVIVAGATLAVAALAPTGALAAMHPSMHYCNTHKHLTHHQMMMHHCSTHHSMTHH